MARPAVLATLMLMTLLTACPLAHGDYASPNFVRDGVTFWWRAPIEIDPDERQLVDEVEIEWFGETVRSGAWVPEGADPHAVLIVQQPASQGGGLAIFIPDGGSLPAELCRYFDPRALESPTECQAPYGVELDGTAYELVVPGGVEPGWDVPAPFRYEAGDLTPLGAVDYLDPRLAAFKGIGIDPMAYAIGGVPQTTAVVLLYTGSGDFANPMAYTFVSAGVDRLPAGLCVRLEDTGEFGPPPDACR